MSDQPLIAEYLARREKEAWRRLERWQWGIGSRKDMLWPDVPEPREDETLAEVEGYDDEFDDDGLRSELREHVMKGDA